MGYRCDVHGIVRLCCRVLPESPRWLLTQNRVEEAHTIMLKVNRHSDAVDTVMTIIIRAGLKKTQSQSQKKKKKTAKKKKKTIIPHKKTAKFFWGFISFYTKYVFSTNYV